MNTDPTPNPPAAPPTLVPGTHCELMVLVSTLTRQFPQGDIYAILASHSARPSARNCWKWFVAWTHSHPPNRNSPASNEHQA